MKQLSIDTDEATRLDIRCKAKRTFDLQVNINLNQDVSGSNFKMEVRNDADELILDFSQSDGLTIIDQSVRLLKSNSDMVIATGVYNYDLIQISPDAVNNLLFGYFIVQPSITIP